MSATPSIIFKTKIDAAIVAPKSELPSDHPARRRGKPLKFWPVGDDDNDRELDFDPATTMPSSSADGLDPALRDSPASVEMVAMVLDGAVAIAADQVRPLRTQIAELKAALVEARHEIRELKLIQESLRISTRGEPGRDGARGVPGRDGQSVIGPRGERGEAGPEGRPAPRITAWVVHANTFEVQPLLSNGTRGAILPLRPLFETFNEAILALDEAAELDAAASARAEAEREAEAAHWAK